MFEGKQSYSDTWQKRLNNPPICCSKRSELPMTNERPSDEHPVQKCSVKMSSLNLSGRGYLLPLASLVFLSIYSVIAVRGFSTVPTTVRGQTKISTIAAVPKHERSTAFGSTRPAKSIRETRSTVMLAGLFGEQTKIKNQNNTYISATSVSELWIRFS